MISEFNLPSIKQGDTYTFSLSFWQDECETTAIDVSTYVFKLMAKNSAGATQFTWNNADFVAGDPNVRTVTISAATTAGYSTGEFSYELQVTTASATYTWMQGYVLVSTQITS